MTERGINPNVKIKAESAQVGITDSKLLLADVGYKIKIGTGEEGYTLTQLINKARDLSQTAQCQQ